MRIDGREISLVFDIGGEEETYALRDVSISLGSKGITGIMGPSGSGKSSLLYVLAGLKKPTTGTVYYDDVDVEALPSIERDRIRRSKLGFVFQRHFLIDYMTVLDNVLVGAVNNGKDSVNAAMELLNELGIAHLARKKPQQLSGGQRQRTAVARALVNNPEVIFADEPTASLDHKNAMEVMDILNVMKKKAAILVVTHDKTILEKADRIIELWDGRIKNTGRSPITAGSLE